jgi:predicted RNase H-like nuclease (RuvC/YqgF family)
MKEMDETSKQLLHELKTMRKDVGELKGMRTDFDEMRKDVGELKGMRTDFDEMRKDVGELKGMRTDFDEMRSDIKQTQMNVNELSTDVKEIQADTGDLKQGQKRLEDSLERLNKNMIDSLGLYSEKIIEHFDDRTEALNKRVFKAETDIQRLKR